MALIKCPECGKEVSDLAVVCVHCGFALKKAVKNRKAGGELTKKYFWGILSILVVLSVALLFWQLNNADISDDVNNPDGIYISDDINIGKTIFFGYYEQNNYEQDGKEKIEWIVLEKKDDRVLVISKYGLDCQPYNENADDFNWASCTLRSWLNNDFINSAFTPSEREKIVTTAVAAGNNTTQDRIFVLSGTEASNYNREILEYYRETYDYDEWVYFEDAPATSFAESQGAWMNGGLACWWIKPPIVEGENVAGYVDRTGLVGSIGRDGIPYDYIAVRPALWINLD